MKLEAFWDGRLDGVDGWSSLVIGLLRAPLILIIQMQGVPKKFLIEIKRSTGENLYTISADREGFTLWSKNLPHLLLAAVGTNRSNLKLFERGPAANFDFYQELFVFNEMKSQTNNN